MSTTDTPRTDAEWAMYERLDMRDSGEHFARTLERELAAAKARNAQLERAYDRLAMQLARLEGLEQDKARLDWLEDDQNRTLLAFTLYASQTYREGIDAARKEAKS
jgi:hypothetical protein